MTTPNRTLLAIVLEHEARQPDRLYLTQPLGGGRVVDYTWGQVLGEARRMAAHLQSRGFERGARIAILSKNCAHFFMAELAIWLGGYTTVAIFPTETADTIRYVLEHSESSLLFVGKLDTWEQQRAGVPAGLPCIAFPLAPASALSGPAALPAWDDVVERIAAARRQHALLRRRLSPQREVYAALARPGGRLVLSGVLAAWAGDLEAAYARHGCAPIDRRFPGPFCTLVLRRG